jgi:hypothetical protein
MGHAPGYFNPQGWHLTEPVGIVRGSIDGLREVLAYLILINIDSGHKLNVPDMIAPQINMHQTGDGILLFGITVVLHSLYQRGSTVPDSNNCYLDLSQFICLLLNYGINFT